MACNYTSYDEHTLTVKKNMPTGQQRNTAVNLQTTPNHSPPRHGGNSPLFPCQAAQPRHQQERFIYPLQPSLRKQRREENSATSNGCSLLGVLRQGSRLIPLEPSAGMMSCQPAMPSVSQISSNQPQPSWQASRTAIVIQQRFSQHSSGTIANSVSSPSATL